MSKRDIDVFQGIFDEEETIHSEREGTDNFILALVERTYFTTRASRRYHEFSGTCSGGEIGHLSSSPLPSSRRTDFPFTEGFLEHNSGACIHLERPCSVHRSVAIDHNYESIANPSPCKDN